MKLFSIETSSASGASGQIWQYFYFRLLGEALGFEFFRARVKFAHFDLNHLLRLPGAMDSGVSRPSDEEFEPVPFTRALDALEDPNALRGKERIRIVFDVNYWHQSSMLQARLTSHLVSKGDAQARVAAILAEMRESARIPNPLAASGPYTIAVHARLGDQFGFKLGHPDPPEAQCLDEQSCAQLRQYIDVLLGTLRTLRASSPNPSRVVLFSDGLWCIAGHDGKRLHDPELARRLNHRYLRDLASAADESYIDYSPSYGELAVQYFAHCDLLLKSVGGFASAIFRIYNRNPDSNLVPFAGRNTKPGNQLSRLIEAARVLPHACGQDRRI